MRISDWSSDVCSSDLQLRRHGYYTVGIGKISHSPDGYIYGYTEPRGTEMELPASWDEMLMDTGKWGTGWNAFFGYADGSNRNDRKKQDRKSTRLNSSH